MRARYVIEPFGRAWRIYDRVMHGYVYDSAGDKVGVWRDPDLVIEARDNLEKIHLEESEKLS